MKVNKNSSYGPIVGCIVILNPLMPNDLYSSADGTPIPPQPSHTETPTHKHNFSLLHGYHPNAVTLKFRHTSKQEHTTDMVIQ